MDAVQRVAKKMSDIEGNNLLRALSSRDLTLIRAGLEEWSGTSGTILHQPGDKVRFAYFPRGASLISYLVILDDGHAIETALIGREGAAGGIVSHGHLPAYTRAEVQLGGTFYRIDLGRLEEIKRRSLTLRHLFDRYADCLMAQIFQSVACNAAHSIEQRTAKWLLAAAERTGTRDLALTQEELSSMLAVGRSYLNRVMGDLKRRQVVRTNRGRITICNVDRLRGLACGCNRSVCRHFEEVLKGVYPTGKSEVAK